MTEPPERTTCVFAIADRSLTVEDVIAAAYFRGDLDAPWDRALFLHECETRAADLGDPDESALQTASEQFRYERDLLTAEETEAWLESRGLTTDDFTNHMVREYWAGQLSESAEPASIDYLSAPGQLHELLRVELLFSGAFDELAFTLGASIAALQKSHDHVAPDLIEAQRARFCERFSLDATTTPAWLAKIQRDEAWLEEMLAGQVAYHLECADVLTPSQCERTLHTLRVPLTHVELETIELECADAANEAVLCVREDGMAMSAVAAEGGYPYREDDRLLEEFPPELQQKLLCAAPGDLLEPIEDGDAFHLIRLNRKIEPALDDSRICARVEREILTRHFTELSSRLVRWQPGFLPQ